MKHLNPDYEQLGVFCRSLGQMYHAGIGSGDAFALMAEDEESSAEKELLEKMSRMADEGMPLARIFQKAECYPDYLCSLVLVGEQVGKIEDTLNALADYYDGRARLEHQLKNALLYPMVLLLVLLVVVFVLLVWVMPVFNDVYARLGSSLSGVAGSLLAIGTLLRKALPFLGFFLALIVCAVIAVSAAPSLREKLLKACRHKFGGRGITLRINTARFVQALAMGLSGGLTEPEAVSLSANLAEGNEKFNTRCQDCLKRLNEGAGLSSALRDAKILSKAQCRLLETGIRAGNGAQVMEKISLKALEDSECELENIAERVESVLVLVMSVLVGAILLSVMLPLMHIMTAIG